MAIAIDPKGTFDYVPIDDRKLGESEQTVFTFRNLNARDAGRLMRDAMAIKGGSVPDAALIDAVSLTCVGIRNFRDAEGNEIPFETEQRHIGTFARKVRAVTENLLDRIGFALIAELGMQVLEHVSNGMDGAGLDEDERGK